MRRNLLLAAVAIAALVLAGCGGGGGKSERLTKSEYEAKITAIGKDVGDRLGKTLSGTKKNSKAAIDKATSALREFVDELDKVNPPAEIESTHADLIKGMRQLADDLGGLVEKLDKAKDPSEALAALFGLKSFQTLLRVQREFQKKGYKLDLGGT